MAYVNIPPNLQDMFYGLSDRIAKLESGPSGPQDTADAAQATAVSAQSLALSSQSTATDAQTQAINAGIQANIAQSQATIAQSQATIASSQAVAAQTSANGKNTIHYSSSSPSGSGTNVGDIWWQYSGSTLIGQWSWNGSSWNPAPITNSVISNLDAGKITTGILSAIEINAGSGGTAFHVSPSGYMSAQGVYVKGNITADSGTFNGTINAQTGYFGGTTNYWSIGSSGITGVGTATITGGQINGSSIYIGSSGQFQVDASGNLNASSATVTGTITTTNLTATGGHIGGFTIGSTYLSGSGNFFLDSSTGNSTFNAINIGLSGVYYFSSTGALSAASVNTTGTGNIGTSLFVGTTLEVTNNAKFDSTIYANTLGTTTSGLPVYQVQSGGNAGYLKAYTSAERFKINITPISPVGYASIINNINPVTYDDIEDSTQKGIPGLIAEQLAEVEGMKGLVVYDSDGQTMGINYEKLGVMLILALKELDIDNRLKKLEGK